MKRRSFDWIALLELILRDAPSLPGALCRDEDPRIFDADADAVAAAAAVALCHRCPALAACERAANAAPHNHVSGVLAGRVYAWLPGRVASRTEAGVS